MKIGNVQIHGKTVLAPMAEYTNFPFRLLAKEFGAGLVYTEMAMAKGIAKKDRRELWLLHTKPTESPVTAQICGRELTDLVTASKMVESLGFSIIDINFCCPVNRILAQNAGGAFMREPNEIGKVIEAVAKAVSIPVTAKILSGPDEKTTNAVEIATICQKAGASAIAIHPRPLNNPYNAIADWSLIRAVKEAVQIPVMGSGDIRNPIDVAKMLENTHCDAVMVARGCLGRPWFFREANHLLTNGSLEIAPITKDKIRQILLRHWKLLKEHAGNNAVLLLRRHLSYYAKSLHNESFAESIRMISTPKELEEAIRKCL